MALVEFYFGQPVIITFTITDPATGTPVAPGAAQISIEDPAGIETIYTSASTPPVTNPSTGKYKLRIVSDQAGTWWARGKATGSNATAADSAFRVLPTRFSSP